MSIFHLGSPKEAQKGLQDARPHKEDLRTGKIQLIEFLSIVIEYLRVQRKTHIHMLIQDPDPSPWLQVTPEMKINNQKKPYGQFIFFFIFLKS